MQLFAADGFYFEQEIKGMPLLIGSQGRPPGEGGSIAKHYILGQKYLIRDTISKTDIIFDFEKRVLSQIDHKNKVAKIGIWKKVDSYSPDIPDTPTAQIAMKAVMGAKDNAKIKYGKTRKIAKLKCKDHITEMKSGPATTQTKACVVKSPPKAVSKILNLENKNKAGILQLDPKLGAVLNDSPHGWVVRLEVTMEGPFPMPPSVKMLKGFKNRDLPTKLFRVPKGYKKLKY